MAQMIIVDDPDGRSGEVVGETAVGGPDLMRSPRSGKDSKVGQTIFSEMGPSRDLACGDVYFLEKADNLRKSLEASALNRAFGLSEVIAYFGQNVRRRESHRERLDDSHDAIVVFRGVLTRPSMP